MRKQRRHCNYNKRDLRTWEEGVSLRESVKYLFLSREMAHSQQRDNSVLAATTAPIIDFARECKLDIFLLLIHIRYLFNSSYHAAVKQSHHLGFKIALNVGTGERLAESCSSVIRDSAVYARADCYVDSKVRFKE